MICFYVDSDRDIGGFLSYYFSFSSFPLICYMSIVGGGESLFIN